MELRGVWPISSYSTHRSAGLIEKRIRRSVDKIIPSAPDKSNPTLKAQSERQKHYPRDYRGLFSNSFNAVSAPSDTIIIFKLIPPPLFPFKTDFWRVLTHFSKPKTPWFSVEHKCICRYKFCQLCDVKSSRSFWQYCPFTLYPSLGHIYIYIFS